MEGRRLLKMIDKELRDEMNTRIDLQQRLAQLEFFTALLLAVSVNRAANLEALETFIKDLKEVSVG